MTPMSLTTSLALAPVWIKGRVLEAVARRISTGSDDGSLQTNLGLCNRLRFEVSNRNIGYAYGRPSKAISERATLELACQLCQRSDIFVDVGANHGLFSTAVRLQQSTLPIIAIEADPEIASQLKKNVERNSLNISVLNAAASDQRGSITFYKNEDDDLSGSLTLHFSQKHRVKEISVESLRLCDLLSQMQHESLLVKVDVEGAGSQVWAGLSGAYAKIAYLIMEVIGPEAEAKLPSRIADATGWHSYYIDDYVLRCTTFSNYRYRAPFWNWLFTRIPPDHLGKILKLPLSVVDEREGETI
jgi:FkbM family methyltransferase